MVMSSEKRLNTARRPRTLLVKYHEDVNIRSFSSRGERTLQVYPALGLMYLAAYLRAHDYPVAILDAHAMALSTAKFQQRVRDFSPDLIGVTATTLTWPGAV